MMDAISAALLSLRRQGLTLRLEGYRLTAGPADKLTAPTRRFITENARALREALRQEAVRTQKVPREGQIVGNAENAPFPPTGGACRYFVGESDGSVCKLCGEERPPHWRVRYTADELRLAALGKAGEAAFDRAEGRTPSRREKSRGGSVFSRPCAIAVRARRSEE
jgi:hypothetical protein